MNHPQNCAKNWPQKAWKKSPDTSDQTKHNFTSEWLSNFLERSKWSRNKPTEGTRHKSLKCSCLTPNYIQQEIKNKNKRNDSAEEIKAFLHRQIQNKQFTNPKILIFSTKIPGWKYMPAKHNNKTTSNMFNQIWTQMLKRWESESQGSRLPPEAHQMSNSTLENGLKAKKKQARRTTIMQPQVALSDLRTPWPLSKTLPTTQPNYKPLWTDSIWETINRKHRKPARRIYRRLENAPTTSHRGRLWIRWPTEVWWQPRSFILTMRYLFIATRKCTRTRKNYDQNFLLPKLHRNSPTEKTNNFLTTKWEDFS